MNDRPSPEIRKDITADAMLSAAAIAAAPSSLIHKTAWSSFGSISLAASSAVIVVAVARLLGPTGAGTVAYGVWVAGTAAQVASLAVPQAAMRFLAAPRDRPGLARWLLLRSLVLVVPAVAIAVAATVIAPHTPALLVTTGLLTAMAMMAAIAQAFLAGEQRFRNLAALSISSALLQVVCVAVGCLWAGAAGALAGHVVGQGPLLLGLRGRRSDAMRPPPEVRARVRSFALQTWVSIVASLVAWSRLEYVFLQGWGPAAVAVYSVAITVTQLALQPTSLLASALVPHFGELVGGEHHDTAKQTFAAVTRVLACIAFPLCFGLAAIAPALVPVLFGEDFAGAVVPAVIVTASAAIVAIGPGVGALIVAHERTRFTAIVAVVSGVLTIPLFAMLIPPFGPVGAAAVRSIVQGAGVAAGFVYAVRHLGVAVPIARLSRTAAASLLAAIAGAAVVAHFGHTWGSVVAGVLIVSAVFALVAPLVRVLERSDVEHLDRLLAPLPPRPRGVARVIVRSLAGAHARTA